MVLMVRAPALGWHRGKAAWLGVSIGIMSVLPLTVFVFALSYPFRFGQFDYARIEAISDPRVVWNMPTAARQITVVKQLGGNYARYRITKAQLHAHLTALWGARVMNAPQACSMGPRLEVQFSALSSSVPSHLQCYASPPQDNGAGSHFYLDADAGLVYSETLYW